MYTFRITLGALIILTDRFFSCSLMLHCIYQRSSKCHFLVWPDRGSNPQFPTLDVSMRWQLQPQKVVHNPNQQDQIGKWYKYYPEDCTGFTSLGYKWRCSSIRNEQGIH